MLINNSGCLNTQSLVARFVVSGLILFIQPLSTPARAQNASYDVNRPKYKVCTYVANITSGPSLADATSDSTVNQDQIKSEIKTTLNSLGNEIESLIDNSKDINLFQSLLQLYAHNSEAIEKANNNINLEILNKVNDFINRMQLTVGFHARVSYLPVELCDRMSSISMANATAAAAGVANPDSHVGMTTKSYNEGGGIEQGFEQTIHHFEGFSFNIIHEVRESKNKVKAKTDQGIKALLQRKLKSKTLITGGIIVSVPSYFNFPMNIEMDFGEYIPTLKLNDIFFGFDKKNPYKHYIVSNIDYASYTNGKLDFNPRGDKHRPPEINLYFTDEVRYNYNENFLSFSPSMERPLHSLLADIEFKYCQDKNFEFCDKDVRINLSMDQLVLNFKPVVLKFSPEKDPAIFLFPFIKSPTHSSLAENGGIRTALKRWPWDKSSLVLFRSLMTSPLLNNLASQWLPIKSETEPRPEILQFFGYGSGNIYLNGKYSPLATLLQKGLDIVNKSLHKKAISGIATLKYLLNENWDPSTGGLIHSDSHSSKNGTTSNTDAWEEDDWDHPSAYLSGSQNVPAAGAQKQLNRGGFIQLDRTGP